MATFTNQATLTYNGQTTTSNVTVGELDGGFLAVGGALLSILRSGGQGDQGKCNQ